ncbi:hypothetical protein PCLA_21f0067 [Pseudomonas citronellolis]|nr:hypothetical protein PCLA_21f0067 [Pseudomonas citronellolis]
MARGRWRPETAGRRVLARQRPVSGRSSGAASVYPAKVHGR